MKLSGFDWDAGNIKKAQKHGLTILEIERFFELDPFVCEDLPHSTTEPRFIAFDSYKDRHIFVAFTIRKIEESLKIRIISARYAHKREVEKFYANKK